MHRRAGQWDAAITAAEALLKEGLEDLFARIARFGAARAAARDDARYTVDDARLG